MAHVTEDGRPDATKLRPDINSSSMLVVPASCLRSIASIDSAYPLPGHMQEADDSVGTAREGLA